MLCDVKGYQEHRLTFSLKGLESRLLLPCLNQLFSSLSVPVHVPVAAFPFPFALQILKQIIGTGFP
jgi:hypothetical protein